MLEVLERSFNRILDGAWSCSYLGLMVCVYFLGWVPEWQVCYHHLPVAREWTDFPIQKIASDPTSSYQLLSPGNLASGSTQLGTDQKAGQWGNRYCKEAWGAIWWLINCLWVCWLFFIAKWAQFMLIPIGLIFRIPPVTPGYLDGS